MRGDHVDLDAAAIVACFDRHHVDYLVVGGMAARLQGALRLTDDFDALPKTDHENVTRLAVALRELGARLRVDGLSDEEAKLLPAHLDGHFLGSMDISTWRTDVGDIDILTAIPDRHGGRVRYDVLQSRASTVDVAGVSIAVESLADIIESKTWANRPKDRAALPELEALHHRSPSVPPDPNPGVDR